MCGHRSVSSEVARRARTATAAPATAIRGARCAVAPPVRGYTPAVPAPASAPPRARGPGNRKLLSRAPRRAPKHDKYKKVLCGLRPVVPVAFFHFARHAMRHTNRGSPCVKRVSTQLALQAAAHQMGLIVECIVESVTQPIW